MRVEHRTHLLFCEPKNPPTEQPIEDEMTAKVDFIFDTLVAEGGYRGFHTTPFGHNSDNKDYFHPFYEIVSNSLAPYYVRYHRADLTNSDIDNINILHAILSVEPSEYYQSLLQSFDKTIYVIAYRNPEKNYGKPQTYIVKVKSHLAIKLYELFKGTFYEFISEEKFNELTDVANQKCARCQVEFLDIEDCEILELYQLYNV